MWFGLSFNIFLGLFIISQPNASVPLYPLPAFAKGLADSESAVTLWQTIHDTQMRAGTSVMPKIK